MFSEQTLEGARIVNYGTLHIDTKSRCGRIHVEKCSRRVTVAHVNAHPLHEEPTSSSAYYSVPVSPSYILTLQDTILFPKLFFYVTEGRSLSQIAFSHYRDPFTIKCLLTLLSAAHSSKLASHNSVIVLIAIWFEAWVLVVKYLIRVSILGNRFALVCAKFAVHSDNNTLTIWSFWMPVIIGKIELSIRI